MLSLFLLQAARHSAALDASQPKCRNRADCARGGQLPHQDRAALQGLHVDEPQPHDRLLLVPRGPAL